MSSSLSSSISSTTSSFSSSFYQEIESAKGDATKTSSECTAQSSDTTIVSNKTDTQIEKTCDGLYDFICDLERAEKLDPMAALTNNRRALELKLLQMIHDDICVSMNGNPFTGASGQASYQIRTFLSKGGKSFCELIQALSNFIIIIVDYEETGKSVPFYALSYCRKPDTAKLLLRFATKQIKESVLADWKSLTKAGVTSLQSNIDATEKKESKS